MRKIIKSGLCSILIAAMLITMPVYAEDVQINNSGASQEDTPNLNPETPPVIECKAIFSLKTEPYSYTKIKLVWSKVSDADGYSIERSTTSGKKFKEIKTITKGSTTSYYDKDVKMGSIYYYRMRAYKTVDGENIYSPYTKQAKQRAQVATAKITSAKKASYHSIAIEWKKVSGASGYAVYRRTSKNGKITRIATVRKGNALTFTDTKRSCGKTYYYQVRAYRTYKKKNYYGSMSEMVEAKTTPNKVKWDDGIVSGAKTVTLRWKKTSGADGYRIYYSTDKKSNYKLAKTIKKSSTVNWKKTKLKENKTYYFKIRAYKNIGKEKVYGSYSTVYKKETVAARLEKVQKKYVGVPYVYGGSTPKGWDCSGFTQWLMRNVYGIEIARSSCMQAQGGKKVSVSNMSEWKPGDLVFFNSGGRVNHVGIYIGEGKMIHALNCKYDTLVHDVKEYDRRDRRNTLAKVRRYIE